MVGSRRESYNKRKETSTVQELFENDFVSMYLHARRVPRRGQNRS